MHPILGTEKKKRGTETQDTYNLNPYFKIQLDFAFGGEKKSLGPAVHPNHPHTHANTRMHTHPRVHTHWEAFPSSSKP